MALESYRPDKVLESFEAVKSQLLQTFANYLRIVAGFVKWGEEEMIAITLKLVTHEEQ